MKRFVFLWSSLFLALVILSYAITMCFFFFAWFLFLLAISSFIVVIRLIKKIEIQAKILTQAQKSYLASSVYRQGWIAFFISIWCASFISRHPYEQCVYATTFGIALFCFFGLCLTLKNYLNSFNSLWEKEERLEKVRISIKFSNSIILYKKLKSMISIGLIKMQGNLLKLCRIWKIVMKL